MLEVSDGVDAAEIRYLPRGLRQFLYGRKRFAGEDVAILRRDAEKDDARPVEVEETR